MIRDALIYLSSDDVASLLPTPSELVELLVSMFQHKAQAAAEMPAKLGVHPVEDGFLHAMPASVPAMSAVGIKWVAAFPGNTTRGLPQVSGLIILNDPETGIARAVLDATKITAARTAAASALAARYLARSNSETLGILGCGVQGQSHVQAFASEFSLRRVFAYDVSSSHATRFASEMSKLYGIDIVVAGTPQAVVESSDMVITAGPITNPPHATIQPGWLQAGAFASSIDYGSYWHARALAEMDILCTDDAAQYASHQKHGYLRGLPAIDLELADLVTRKQPGRTDTGQRTFACNLGIALEDVVVAKAVVDRAEQLGIGLALPR